MRDLAKRLTASFIAVSTLFVVLFFAQMIFFQGLFALLIALLCGFALFEFTQIAKAKGVALKIPFFISSGILFTLSFLFLPHFAFFIFLAFFFLSFLLQFRQLKGALFTLGTNLLGFLYIALPLGLVFPILYFPREDGRIWLFYLLAVTKSADIGGYFGGLFFGKRKLAEHLSPKKTIEGFIGGTLLSLFASYLFYYLGSHGILHNFNLTLTAAFGLGLVLTLFGQLGDLAESLLKRDAEIKDSGHLPGFGGILDLLDSLLFNLPILFFYLEVIK